MTPLALLTLPDPAYLVIGAVIVALVALYGIGQLLKFLREFRSELANELKREIGESKEPSPMSVQQPLVIKGHQELVTRDEHKSLAERMDQELGRERGARKQIHQEIGALQASVAAITKENTKQTSDLQDLKQDIKEMNVRIDLVPERTINLLKTTGVIK